MWLRTSLFGPGSSAKIAVAENEPNKEAANNFLYIKIPSLEYRVHSRGTMRNSQMGFPHIWGCSL